MIEKVYGYGGLPRKPLPPIDADVAERLWAHPHVQELVARLTHTPIATHNSSTNATLNDNPVTFPLNNSLYVDATHEVVVLNGE